MGYFSSALLTLWSPDFHRPTGVADGFSCENARAARAACPPRAFVTGLVGGEKDE